MSTQVFPTPPSGGGGGGTPASTVTSTTVFGQSSAVGTSTDYARADHVHGSPNTPPTYGSDLSDGSPDFNGTATVLGIIPSSSTYTLNQNVIADTMTIRTGIRVIAAGYVIYAKKLTIEAGGFLSANGNNASSSTAGAAFTNTGYLGWSAGAGGNGITRTTAGATSGNAGAGSGGSSAGGTGGSGGAVGATAGGAGSTTSMLAANQFKLWRTEFPSVTGWKLPPTGTGTGMTLVNGGGGGGGGSVSYASGTGNAISGGGGGAAGVIGIKVGELNNLGTIEAVGGSGANGTVAVTAVATASGGGGGSGGVIHAVVDTVTSLGTFSVAGGGSGNSASTAVPPVTAPGMLGTPGTFVLFVGGVAQ